MEFDKIFSKSIYFCSVILLALILIGGCNIDFSTQDEDGRTSNESKIDGTIVSTLPDRNLDGILVQIEDEDTGVLFSDTTNTGGVFEIEGGFSGSSLMLEFFDENVDQLALTSITVFPGAEIDLGDIRIENGIVNFEDVFNIRYIGELTDNNCMDGNGTLIVTENGTDVIVLVTNSTDIVREDDDQEIECEELLIGDELDVRGDLIGDTIDAFDIEI